MLSIDANLLFYAFNRACPEHHAASTWLTGVSSREDVALSEFILCEFYVLLRNPAVVRTPLGAGESAEVINGYRRHPRWKIVGFPPLSRELHDSLWRQAAETGFARRRLFDVRTAMILQAFGVKEFATANLKDFADLGFSKVWNPLEDF
jgi:uncharacterized protein